MADEQKEKPRSRIKWWVIAAGIAAVITGLNGLFAMCGSAGLATPLNAASKEQVEMTNERITDNTERIQKLEESHAEIRGWLEAIGRVVGAEYDPRVDDSR